MTSERSMERKVAGGVAWSFMEKFLTMLVQMVVSIIVARQLMPEDFGVMAIMTFFTSVALTIVDSGFSQTLIRKAQPTDEEYRSVLGFNVIVSIVLYVVLVAISTPLAHLYGHDAIAEISPVLLLILPINSLCVVQTVMFTREFRFALLSKIVLASSLISGIIAIAMAVAGCGIWSLVAQRLVAMGIKAAAFWWIRRWRTTAKFNIQSLRSMAPFSLRLLATDLLASIYNNVAQLFIGKIYSTTALGYYSQAQKLKDLPVTSTVQAVQGVTYPALSKMAEGEETLASSYRRILMLVSFVISPVMLGLVAIAPEMFALLLGDKWMPTVPFFEILALAGLFYPLAVIAYNILKVRSDGRIIFRLELLKRMIMTLVLILCIPQGIESVAWGMTAMALIELVMNIVAARRYVACSYAELAMAILPHLLAAGAMFGTLYLISPYFMNLTLGIRLMAKVATGAAIYLLLSWVMRLPALNDSISLLRRVIKSRD